MISFSAKILRIINIFKNTYFLYHIYYFLETELMDWSNFLSIYKSVRSVTELIFIESSRFKATFKTFIETGKLKIIHRNHSFSIAAILSEIQLSIACNTNGKMESIKFCYPKFPI